MSTTSATTLATLALVAAAAAALPAAAQKAAAPPQADVHPPQPIAQVEGRPAVARQAVPGQPGSRTIVKPPATERCLERPTTFYWTQRGENLLATIKRTARRIGLIQAIRVADQYQTVTAKSERPAGWAAYAFAVPGQGNLKVTLNHPNEGWFRLLMVDRWGGAVEGMFQNIIPKGYPTVSFHNPKEETQMVFVIVDDPGWMSSENSLYTLAIDRDWAPGKPGPKVEYPQGGVWAVLEPKAGTPPPAAGKGETPSTQP